MSCHCFSKDWGGQACLRSRERDRSQGKESLSVWGNTHTGRADWSVWSSRDFRRSKDLSPSLCSRIWCLVLLSTLPSPALAAEMIRGALGFVLRKFAQPEHSIWRFSHAAENSFPVQQLLPEMDICPSLQLEMARTFRLSR